MGVATESVKVPYKLLNLSGNIVKNDLSLDLISEIGTIDNPKKANVDGTILYHILPWTNAGSVSITNNIVTGTNTAFTSGMVGAKLIVNGINYTIATYNSATSITITTNVTGTNSASYGNWGVYSKAYEILSNGVSNTYGTTGVNSAYTTATGYFNVPSLTSATSKWTFDTVGAQFSYDLILGFSSTGEYTSAKDVGIKRNSAGVLEINNGITGGAYRDLIAQNVCVSGNFYVNSKNISTLYLPITGTAANSTKLNNIDSSQYLKTTLTKDTVLVGNSSNIATESATVNEWVVGATQPGQKEVKGLMLEMVVSDGSTIATPIIIRKIVTINATGQIPLLTDALAGYYYVIKSIKLVARGLGVTQYPTISIGCNASTYNDIAASQTINTLSNGVNEITLTTNAGKALIEANASMMLNVITPIIGSGTFKIIVEGYVC